MGMIEIKTVQTRRDLAEFIRLPSVLYADDPDFIAPLSFERRARLSAKKPYFEHAGARYFLACDAAGKPVGRISAQIDEHAQKPGQPKTGHFGFVDSANEDVLKHLLDAAENWLRGQGARRVQGAYSLSINDEAGLLIEGHDSPPRMMMNYAPPWLGPAIERTGYRKAKDLLAFHMRADQNLPAAAGKMAEKAAAHPGVRERPLQDMETDLGVILDIFNEAWADNWGFVPFTAAEIKHTARSMKPLVIPDLVRIAEIDGRAAAMIVALPDLNEALKGLGGELLPLGWARLIWRLKVRGVQGARVLLMGVRKDYQSTYLGSGLAVLLIARLHEALNAQGFKEVELSWILEDNMPVIRMIEMTGGKAYKQYRIYEKDLI